MTPQRPLIFDFLNLTEEAHERDILRSNGAARPRHVARNGQRENVSRIGNVFGVPTGRAIGNLERYDGVGKKRHRHA